MLKQYEKLQKSQIKPFFLKKHYSLISTEKPKIGQRVYWIAPPLYTLDKKNFIIYLRTFFINNNKIAWDDLYILYKIDVKYKLLGYLKWENELSEFYYQPYKSTKWIKF